MKKTIKDSLIAIADGLGELEAAVPSTELTAFHEKVLRPALYRHRNELGLSDKDVAEIDGRIAGTMAGTPKTPPEEPPEDDE